MMGLEASYMIAVPAGNFVSSFKLSANVTNLGDEKGVSTAVVTGASGSKQAIPWRHECGLSPWKPASDPARYMRAGWLCGRSYMNLSHMAVPALRREILWHSNAD